MTKNDKMKQDALLNPKFGLNTDNPDIKGFLAWLVDPEVTEAYKQLELAAEQDEDSETTCNFCSKDWIGYVTMPDSSMPWVCETHWDIYSTT
jgi:hypothetical protein